MKKFLLALFGVLLASGCGPTNLTYYYSQTPPVKNPGQEPALQNQNKTCAPGFIAVPGSALYHTSDFCVMKYDAKAADTSNPAIGLQPKLGDPCLGQNNGHSFGTYKNNGPGCAVTSQNNKEIVSVPSGFPITYIPEIGSGSDNAKNYCQQMGWHLITNPEWMTIARNIEQVPANWCNPNGTACGALPGTKGKILANGHNDNHNEASAGGSSFNSALIASVDDSQACYGTTTDGSNTCGGTGSQKRTLELSNGQIIWDFAGWTLSDFAPGSLASVITDNGQNSALGYDSFRPSNPNWNASNGVGRIYHYSSANDTDTTLYGFIRGGNWKHGTDDGAFYMHLTPVPDKTNIDDVGFRCTTSLQ